MSRYEPDHTGAQAAIRISRLIEAWGDARFPVDVELLARHCAQTYGWSDPITRIHGEEWDGIEGALIPAPEANEWWIIYNTRSTPERQRFTIAHELGHYILHRRLRDQFRCGTGVVS
jgi:hypothetical protein